MRYGYLFSAAAGGLLLSSVAGFAGSDYYNTNPTPAEQAQTQQLNQDATQGIPQDGSQGNAAGDAYQQKQQQYQSQMDQYRRDQERYQHRRAAYEQQRMDYHLQREEYRASRDWYVQHHYTHYIGYPTYPDRDLQRIYLIADPTHQLHRARVIDRAGFEIGWVRDVETAPDGRPARLQIALDDNHYVWVRDSDARFDAYEATLYTKLDGPRLWEMAR